MNKKLVAIAVAAALAPAVAAADAMVYGKLHLSVESQNDGTTSSGFLSSNSSRLGVKGSTDLGGGLTGLLQVEGGVAPGGANTWGATRDSFLGLKGDFGTVLAGRLPAANQYVYDANYFADQLGDAANFTGTAMPGRADNALHYVTPNFGPIGVALTHVVEQGTANRGANAVRVTFGQDNIKAAFTYFKMGTALAAATLDSVTAISGGYAMGDMDVSGALVNTKSEGGMAGADRRIFTLGAAFKMNGGKFKAQFSSADEGAANANDGATMVAVGYDHSMAKNVTVYGVFASVSNKSGGSYHPFNWGHGAGNVPAAGKNASGFGAGMVYDF